MEDHSAMVIIAELKYTILIPINMPYGMRERTLLREVRPELTSLLRADRGIEAVRPKLDELAASAVYLARADGMTIPREPKKRSPGSSNILIVGPDSEQNTRLAIALHNDYFGSQWLGETMNPDYERAFIVRDAGHIRVFPIFETENNTKFYGQGIIAHFAVLLDATKGPIMSVGYSPPNSEVRELLDYLTENRVTGSEESINPSLSDRLMRTGQFSPEDPKFSTKYLIAHAHFGEADNVAELIHKEIFK
jgi:hypothetical protein